MTRVEQVSFENQLLKNVTMKFAVIFVVGSFIFGLTVSGAVYRYMDNVDKRFNRVEKQLSDKVLSDYFRREQIDAKFGLLSEQIKTVQDTHRAMQKK